MTSEKKRKRSDSVTPDETSTSKRSSSTKDEHSASKKKIKMNANEKAPTGPEQKRRRSPIAHPMAGRKLTKRLYKLIQLVSKSKSLRRGVKEVVKSLRKHEGGVCVLAGDVSPVDVVSHLPVLCEESNVAYCFVPSREELGAAGQTKRPTSVMMIVMDSKLGDEERTMLIECTGEIQQLLASSSA